MRSAPSVTVELDKALIVGALAALVGLGWLTGAPVFERFGQGRLTYLTVLAFPLLLVALLLVRGTRSLSRGVVAAWWPVFGILAVYESLKHMHANRITAWLGIEPQDRLMLALDEALFGKALPLWMDGWTAPWFQELMSFFYIWVYYLGPFALLAYAFLARRDDLFRRLRLGLVVGLLGGYALYLLVPVAGPKFLVGDQFRHAIPTHSRLETLVFDTLRFNWDCFPSLHTAIPWLLTLLVAGRTPRWVVASGALLSSGVTLSTVALRFHYGVDLIAAFVWVAVVWLCVDRLAASDYGRFRVALSAGRRRARARLSAARGALVRRHEVLALLGAGNALLLVAVKRWADAWTVDPVASTGWSLTGACLGLAAGGAIARRAAARLGGAHAVVATAGLGTAAWLLVLGAGTAAGRSGGLLAAVLAATAGGPLAGAAIAAGTLPGGALLGAALWAASAARGEVGLRPEGGSGFFWAATGAFAGLVAGSLVFLPVLGYGDALLVTALTVGVATWRCQAAGEGARPPRRRRAVASREGAPGFAPTVAAAAVGAAVPAWAAAYASALGDAALALPKLLVPALAGSALALALAPRLSRRQQESEATAGALLLAAALALAAAIFLFGGFPGWIGERGVGLSARTVERLRGLAAAMAVLPAAAALVAAAASGRAVPRRGAASALAAALGCAIWAFGALPGWGERAALAALWALVGATGWLAVVGGERRWRLGALALLPLLAGGGLLAPEWPLAPRIAGESLDPGALSARVERFEPLGSDAVAGELGRATIASSPAGALAAIVGGGLVYALPPAAGQEATARVSAELAPGRRRALVLGPAVGLAERLAATGFAEVELVEPSVKLLAAALTVHGGGSPAGFETVVSSARVRLAADGEWDLVVSHLEDYRVALRRREVGRELDRLVRRRLAPGGVFVQAIRLGRLSFENLETIAATLRAELPEVSLRLADGYVLLAASAAPAPAASAAVPPPLLTAERIFAWTLERDPALESDRSGFLEWNRAPRAGDEDATRRTVARLLRLAGTELSGSGAGTR